MPGAMMGPMEDSNFSLTSTRERCSGAHTGHVRSSAAVIHSFSAADGSEPISAWYAQYIAFAVFIDRYDSVSPMVLARRLMARAMRVSIWSLRLVPLWRDVVFLDGALVHRL